jgi:large subunit ribosomal protein L21
MYAVVQTGGKQYRVTPGDTIRIEKLPWQVGSDLELHSVLAVFQDPGQLLAGDQLANSKVLATIVAHGRGEKIKVFKFKRKKQYKRTTGHRQDYTAVKVTGIVVQEPGNGA